LNIWNDCAVLISSFNSSETLQRCLEGINRQTLLPDHIYFFDDNHKASEFNILKNHCDIPFTYFKNTKKMGLTHNLHLALATIPYAFVARLDVDDFWTTDHLAASKKVLDDNQATLFVGNLRSDLLQKDLTYREIIDILSTSNPFIHSSIVFNNQLLRQNNFNYDIKYKFSQDYELLSQIALNFNFNFLPVSTVNIGLGGNGRISVKRKRSQGLFFFKAALKYNFLLFKKSKNFIKFILNSIFLTINLINISFGGKKMSNI